MYHRNSLSRNIIKTTFRDKLYMYEMIILCQENLMMQVALIISVIYTIRLA